MAVMANRKMLSVIIAELFGADEGLGESVLHPFPTAAYHPKHIPHPKIRFREEAKKNQGRHAQEVLDFNLAIPETSFVIHYPQGEE